MALEVSQVRLSQDRIYCTVNDPVALQEWLSESMTGEFHIENWDAMIRAHLLGHKPSPPPRREAAVPAQLAGRPRPIRSARARLPRPHTRRTEGRLGDLQAEVVLMLPPFRADPPSSFFSEFPFLVEADPIPFSAFAERMERIEWVETTLGLERSQDFTFIWDTFRFRNSTKAAMFKLRWG